MFLKISSLEKVQEDCGRVNFYFYVLKRKDDIVRKGLLYSFLTVRLLCPLLFPIFLTTSFSLLVYLIMNVKFFI